MPTGSPGRMNVFWTPSRSADSERTVTLVRRSIAVHILYIRRVVQSNAGHLAPALTSCLPQLDSPYLHRNRDPLGAQASEDALTELVLDEELVVERLHVTEQREIERVLAEPRDEPDRGRRLPRETADAEGREDRRDLDAKGSQQHEQADDEAHAAGDGLAEARDQDAERPPLARPPDEGAQDVRDRDGHGEDRRGLEDAAELLGQAQGQALGLAGELDRDPESEADQPENRRAPDRPGARGPPVRASRPTPDTPTDPA